MGRIERYYERQFGELLGKMGGTDPEREVPALFQSARERAAREGCSLSFQLASLHADLVRRAGVCADSPQTFVCDSGLGGLARWLRGAGYDAFWRLESDDAAVIREAQQRYATLITTDSLMIERGVLRDRLVPNVFVPSTLTCEQQLEIVLRQLGLTPRESRCMQCGGQLRKVPRESVAERIPPKTARWLEEYFLCERCNHLFWRGTHWQRIQRRLREL